MFDVGAVRALVLSALAGLSTMIGALIIVFTKQKEFAQNLLF